jgi:hypothetical protein
MAALTGLGGEVSQHRTEDATRSNGWQIAAAIPDQPPDRSHQARVAQLSSLVHRHGGQLSGFEG